MATAVLVGVLAGLLAPLPERPATIQGAAPQAMRTLSVSEAAPEPPGCASDEERGALEREIEAFAAPWGTPPATPADWDPTERERVLGEAVDALGDAVLLSAVRCELFPCSAVIVTAEEPDRDAWAETFGLERKAFGVGTTASDDPPVTLYVTVVHDLVMSTLTRDERRFAIRSGNEHADELDAEVEALLGDQGG